VAWSNSYNVTVERCNFGMAICCSDTGLICYVREGVAKTPGTITAAGGGYTNGKHFVAVTGGSGFRAYACVEIAGGVVIKFTPVVSGWGFVTGNVLGISGPTIGAGAGFQWTVGDLLDLVTEPNEKNWHNANRYFGISLRSNKYGAITGNGSNQYNFWFGLHYEDNNSDGYNIPEIDIELRSNQFFGMHGVSSYTPIGTPNIRERGAEGSGVASAHNVYWGSRIVHQLNTNPAIAGVAELSTSTDLFGNQLISNDGGALGYDFSGTILKRAFDAAGMTGTSLSLNGKSVFGGTDWAAFTPVLDWATSDLASLINVVKDCRWLQIGNIVFAAYDITFDTGTFGAAAGALKLSLPVAGKTGKTQGGLRVVFHKVDVSATGIDIEARISSADLNNVTFYYSQDAGAQAQVTTTHVVASTSGFAIRGIFGYQV
jgi:hypothetical protein